MKKQKTKPKPELSALDVAEYIATTHPLRLLADSYGIKLSTLLLAKGRRRAETMAKKQKAKKAS